MGGGEAAYIGSTVVPISSRGGGGGGGWRAAYIGSTVVPTTSSLEMI